MLGFFRKYQKFFFIFTAVIAIISFTFFGTQGGTNLPEREQSNRKLVKALDGKWIFEKDVKGLAYLIDGGSGVSAGILEETFFSTALADLLAERFFANFQPELEERLERVQRYRPYSHPAASFLSAEAVWRQLSPEISENLALLKAHKEEVNPQTMKLLFKLYQAQSQFPAESLRRILFYQQSQFSWIQPDEELLRRDLSLFRFKSIEDWFGSQFAFLVSEFIINAAAYAEQQGYRVTKEEAYAQLLKNASQTVQAYSPKEGVNSSDAQQFLVRSLHAAGFTQNEGIELWRKVLLFKRLFHETGEALFLDPLAHEAFSHFALEKASLHLFQMAPEFRLGNFRSLLKLQVYLEAIAPKTNGLGMPTRFFSVEEIESRSPELVQRRFLLELMHVKKEELIQKVSLKTTWEWELSEEHWDLIVAEFPLLAGKPAKSREERFALLEKLDTPTRDKIDRFAQGKIVDAHPSWLEEAFEHKSLQQITLGIRKGEVTLPLKGIEDLEILHAFLEDAHLKSEDPHPYGPLQTLSQDKENYYRIWVVEKPQEREVLTFKQAESEGILDKILDKRLEAAYLGVCKSDPKTFQLADGNWKPFTEVKNEIGAHLYKTLLKQLDEHYPKQRASTEGFDFYAHYRFHPYMLEMKELIVKDPHNKSLIQEEEDSSLATQWKLVKSITRVKRSETPEAFHLDLDAFSGVHLRGYGDLHFFQLIERIPGEPLSAQEVTHHQELLAHEVRREWMEQLLDIMAKRNAIDLSYLIPDRVK